MLKKAAGLLLVCASVVVWVSCSTTASSHYLYAAQPTANNIVAYREDPNSGVLTLLSVSPIAAGPAVQALALHPSKKYLYAANSFENDISLFTIDASGVLTEVTPRPKTDTAPTLLAMNSAGSFLYVGNSGSNDVSVFSIDASSGQLTQVGTPVQLGFTPTNMRVSASGNFLYVMGASLGIGLLGNIEVFNLSAGVPNQVPVQIAQVGSNPYGMTIDPSDKHLYVANSLPDNSISEFTINSDGSLTTLATIGGGTLSSPIALLIDNSGKYLFVANAGASNLSAYAIATDGSLTLLSVNESVATNKSPSFMVSDPNGKYVFVGNSSSPAIQSFSLDPGTGTLTSVTSYTVADTPTSIVVVP